MQAVIVSATIMAREMSPDNGDAGFMRLALAQALKGVGRTSPNPCVGAVIVKDGRVIARGYHKKAGTPHAEINALGEAGHKSHGATMYVTLEPCSHTGKTPPCCNAVVESGIKRVVIGMLDPNPLVDGGGVQYLLDHGVQVSSGVLAQECRDINRPFLKYITTGLPLVTVKAGISLDGRLSYQKDKSGWMTGPQTSESVHQLRNISDAILVGSNTISVDNPSLTTRLSNGGGRDAIRIILDSQLSILPSAKVLNLDSEAPTWIFCSSDVEHSRIKKNEKTNTRVFPVEKDETDHLDLAMVVRILGENGVTSVLVEGGGSVHASFLQHRLVDRACLFIAPLFAGSKGVPLTSGLTVADRENAIRLTEVHYARTGNDIMVEGKVTYPENDLIVA